LSTKYISFEIVTFNKTTTLTKWKLKKNESSITKSLVFERIKYQFDAVNDSAITGDIVGYLLERKQTISLVKSIHFMI